MEQFHKRKSAPKNMRKVLRGLDFNQQFFFKSHGLSNDEYHALPMSISSSIVKDMANEKISDFYVYEKHIKKSLEREVKDVFNLGSTVHNLILEPKKFNKEFAVFEGKGTRASKAYKEFAATNEGKTLLLADQYKEAKAMAKAALKNPVIKTLISDGDPELSCFMKDPITGLTLKARADWKGEGYIADVKSCRDSSPKGFMKDLLNYGYDIQAAFYSIVFDIDPNDFIFVCIENTPPYQTAIYTLDAETMEAASLRVRDALDRLALCNELGQWSGWSTDKDPIQKLKADKWYLKKYLGA